MTTAFLCSSDDARSWEIRSSLSDVDVEITRQYSTSSALLAALSTVPLGEVDLVIIDQVVKPMSLWDLTREVAVRLPSTAVVAVVDEPSPEDYSRAMDAGARGVIHSPLTFEDVSQKITSALGWVRTVRTAVERQFAERDQPSTGGSMVTLSSAKGGTGATTLATHLAIAAAISAPEKKVVLVDLDLQKPDISVLLNVPQHRTIADLLGVVDELTPRQLEDVLYTAPEGHSILFGPRNGEEGELVSEHAAQQILGMLRSRFDLVIVDTGSVMGEANSTAVEMADAPYIVATCDVLSLRGARRLAELWKRLGVRPTDKAAVILNKTDRQSDIQPDAARKIVDMTVVEETVPSALKSIELAMNRRDPALAAPTWSTRVMQLGVSMGIVSQQDLDIPSAPKKSRNRRGRSGRAAAAQPEPSAPSEGDSADGGAPSGGAPTEPPPPPETPHSQGMRSERRSAMLRRSESGQSSLEFLGVTILFGLIAAIGFQLLLVGMTWIFAASAANEGARAAAVDQSAEAAARERTPQAWRSEMTVRETGSAVEVTMEAPLLVNWSEDFALTIPASAGVLEEPR